MSRGHGELQRAVISHIQSATSPLTVESLRWELYEKLEKPEVPAGGELPGKWNTSFVRAVKKVAADPRRFFAIERRRLKSLDECISHYPGKSLQVDVRHHREKLLPALLEWTQDKHGASPHYSEGENEIYYVNRLSQNRRDWLRQEWTKLEALIRPTFAELASEHLLLLFLKARALFQGLNAKSPFSFAAMVELSCNDLPATVAEQLRAFAKKFVSDTNAGALKLQSFVHEFANVPRHGQCSLRKDTLEALHRLRPQFIEALPGFDPGHGRFMREPKYPDALHKLFDQTVFQKFQFIVSAA